MNPSRRIALLAETLGPAPRPESSVTTTREHAAVMLRFARPRSKEARRLKRQAKGTVAPTPLTADAAARMQAEIDAAQAMFDDAARTSAAAAGSVGSTLPPAGANGAASGSPGLSAGIPGGYGGLLDAPPAAPAPQRPLTSSEKRISTP